MNRGASVLLGGIAVILAMGALGPLAALAAGWFLMSPDPVASTARGGGMGAIGAAASAAANHLAEEWRAGGPARQRRRTERRDRWWAAGGWRRRALSVEHGLILAGRALRTGLGAAGRAAVVAPAGARAGAQAAREHRAQRQANRGRKASTVPDGGPAQNGQNGQKQDPSSGSSAPTDPDGQPAAGQETPTAPTAPAATPGEAPDTTASVNEPNTEPDIDPNTTGDGMSETTTAPVGSSELQSTEDLRAECHVISRLLEEAAGLGGLLKDWQTGLPEAYEGGNANGGPKTRALDEAVASVAEAGDDGQALGEALGAIRQGCNQADSLGEHASAMGADGHTKGYVPA